MNATSIDTRDAPGWYGKLSALGDFASRRIANDSVQALDHWLSHSMAASQQALGERWLDTYLTAPAWRFAWAPGVIDTRWWFGVLMPSCDNVGRYFPLLIAHARERPPLDRIAFDHLEIWWNHLADAALQTLHEQASLEAFETTLQQAPPWPTPGMVMISAPQAAPGRERYNLAPGATLGQWLHGFSVRQVHAQFAQCSLWWSIGDSTHAGSFSMARGLPEPSSFAELLTGGW